MKDDTDEKIKQTLKNQTDEIDSLIEGGMTNYIKLGFASRFAGIMRMGYALAIILSGVLIWCAFEFFTASSEHQIFWGVCLILSFNAQVAVKLWIFMQTNRNILSRELRLMALRRL